jgi:hypothetical protein
MPLLALDAAGLNSKLEVAQPTTGALGMVFSVTNNNLGTIFWADPITNDLSSYSQVGLGGKYYFSKDMRLAAALDFFGNSWTYANKDQVSLLGTALQSEFDFIIIGSGPVALYAGPMAEVGFTWGSSQSHSNGIKTSTSGQTYTVGGVIGAEYFPHSQFSVGASCPLEYRFVTTSTNNPNALVGPSESSLFGLGSINLDLTYYF